MKAAAPQLQPVPRLRAECRVGIAAQIPWFNRYHMTIAPGDVDISTSHTKSIGDVRLVARYRGLASDRSVGVLSGLKLPTGSFHNTFIDGPQEGEPLDRGLQPGTGTTDLLLGAYTFGALDRDWDCFAETLLQQPLNSREDFRPGTGLNVTLGARYVSFGRVTPQIQLNMRTEGRESGRNADIENSGATLVYFSPGPRPFPGAPRRAPDPRTSRCCEGCPNDRRRT